MKRSAANSVGEKATRPARIPGKAEAQRRTVRPMANSVEVAAREEEGDVEDTAVIDAGGVMRVGA